PLATTTTSRAYFELLLQIPRVPREDVPRTLDSGGGPVRNLLMRARAAPPGSRGDGGRVQFASARRGSSESCSASGAWRSPRGSCRRLCHHTRIPAPPAPVISPGEPATNSARDGWTPNLSRASLYGSGLGL